MNFYLNFRIGFPLGVVFHLNKINVCVTHVGGRCAPLSNGHLNKTYLLFSSTGTLFIQYKTVFPWLLVTNDNLYQTKLNDA